MSVTISHMIPAAKNMSAIARSGLVHHHSPNTSVPTGHASQGMTRNCVSGPTRNAVRGEAIFSILCPKPNTRPCRSRGTTFCMMVCSHASAIGPTIIQRNIHTPVRMMLGTEVNMIHIDQATILVISSDLTGFFPSPYRDTMSPPMMNPTLVIARIIHHVSTLTSERLYASMSAMNIPPRKLFIIAKNIIANSHDIPAMIRMVPIMSIFFSLGSSLSRCSSRGKWIVKRCAITMSVETILIPTAQSIPSCPMINPEKTETTLKTSPFTAQT